MSDYCYKKIFAMRPDGNVVLTNDAPVTAYANKKIDSLANAQTPAETEHVVSVILKEFAEIYQYDVKNAVVPEPFGSFVSLEEKNAFIERELLFEDMTRYLGHIFCNYHYNLAFKNRIAEENAAALAKSGAYKIPQFILSLQIPKLVIDYEEMYRYATNDYFMNLIGVPQQRFAGIAGNFIPDSPFQIKGLIQYPAEPDKWLPGRYWHTYGAMFIYPMLLEHFLLIHLQNRVLYKGLDALGDRLSEGSIVLSSGERKLYDEFVSAKKTGHGTFSGNQIDTMRKASDIFEKHKIITLTKDEKCILIGSNDRNAVNTIGTVLHSNYAKKEIRPEYYELLQFLFGKKPGLSIRNNTMHGNSTVFDYSLIGFSAIILQLLWAIGNGWIFV